MPTTPLRPILQAALTYTRDTLAVRTDAALLHAFATVRDEAAFGELVRRHGRLVRGAARRIVGDVDAADDVFQAAFLLLARKADSVPWGPTVGPWLYQVACRLAAKARAKAGRRPSTSPVGLELPAPATDPSAGIAWAEVRDALDRALSALPASLRDPLVLCYLEGLTRDEAAAALRCSPAAVKGRVARGRGRLRQLLAGRGLSLSTALAAPLVAECGVQAGAAAVARAAIAFRTTGAAAPAVQELLRGTLTGWRLASVLFGLALVCATAVGLAAARPAADPAPPATTPPHQAATNSAQPAADAFGDPLPDGAVARLGTQRLCGPGTPNWLGFSPDGTKIASSGLGALIVWDTANGRRLVARLRYEAMSTAIGWRADGAGVAVVLLMDGSYVVSAFTDPDEKLPDPPAPFPPPRNVLNPGPWGGQFMALSPDATKVGFARNPEGDKFTIDLLPATPGRLLSELKPERTLGPFPGPCRDLRYTTNGSLVFLSGSWENKEDWSIAVIDVDKDAVARTTHIPPPDFEPSRYMVSLSPDGRYISVPPRTKPDLPGHDDKLQVWDLESGKERLSVPFGQDAGGGGHAYTPDGKRLIVSTKEHYFQIWDLAASKESLQAPTQARPIGSRGRVSALAVSSDGKRFATGREDGRVDIWDAATGKSLVPFATHRDEIDAVAVSPDGRLAATMGFDESIRVWELTTGKPVCVMPVRRGKEKETGWNWIKRRPLFTPDGRGLLFTADGELTMADPTTGKLLDLPEGMRGRKGRLGGFSADGKTLATFADDLVTLWDWPAVVARETITVPLAPTSPLGPTDHPEVAGVYSVSLSPDGRLVFTNSVRMVKGDASGGGQNSNDVWDVRTGKHLHRLTAPEPWYPPAAFSPDGRAMYLGGHSSESPDGKEKQADSLTAWDPAAGTLLRRFADPTPHGPYPTHPDMGRNVAALALSPDGRLLAVGGNVWIYEAVSGEVLEKLAGSGHVNDFVFTADGRRLVSVSSDTTGLVWDTTLPALGGAPVEKPTDAQLAEAWDRLAAFDPQPAYAAMAVLAAAPDRAVALLKAKLRPAAVPTDADLDRVVRQLDADTFAEREAVSAELNRFGLNAVAGAKLRLSKTESAEVRNRLGRFLDQYDGERPSPYNLRCIRGVAALEAMGTADASALLAELAKGRPDDILTQEARSADRRGTR